MMLRTVSGSVAPRRRLLLLLVSLTGLGILAGAADARPRQPLTTCQGTSLFCASHFHVHIQGTQYIDWSLARQRTVGGDCYHIPYEGGTGGETVSFAGDGIVQATGSGNEATFQYLPANSNGATVGIGAGRARVSRTSSLVLVTAPGPCGGSGTTQPLDSGCGSVSEALDYTLNYDPAHRTASLQAIEPTHVPALDQMLSTCKVFWSGIPEFQGGQLYPNVSTPLSVSQLYKATRRTIVLRAHQVFRAPSPPSVWASPPIGTTTVDWTITFTRIRHSTFPMGRR